MQIQSGHSDVVAYKAIKSQEEKLMTIQELLSGFISNQQFSDAVNKRHYFFAHQIMPEIVKNHFQDLVSKVINESAQDWILQIWCKGSEIPGSDYLTLVHPTYRFIQPSNDIGVILISMPAPRAPTEAAYTAVVFAIEKHRSTSDWLRYYFTLELGLDESAYWVLGAWDNSTHISLGRFEYEPTLENFLGVVIAEGQKRWQ